MANARKCDRCERCYDPLKETGAMARFQNPILQEANNIKAGIVKHRLIANEKDCWIDLCPTCTTDFYIFMNKKEDDS